MILSYRGVYGIIASDRFRKRYTRSTPQVVCSRGSTGKWGRFSTGEAFTWLFSRDDLCASLLWCEIILSLRGAPFRRIETPAIPIAKSSEIFSHVIHSLPSPQKATSSKDLKSTVSTNHFPNTASSFQTQRHAPIHQNSLRSVWRDTRPINILYDTTSSLMFRYEAASRLLTPVPPVYIHGSCFRTSYWRSIFSIIRIHVTCGQASGDLEQYQFISWRNVPIYGGLRG